MLGHGQIGFLAIGQLLTQPGEIVTQDKWYSRLSEPVRTTIAGAMIALAASGGVLVEFSPFNETVTESRWHQPLSEPVRTLPTVVTGAQQAFAFHPSPLVSFGWYEPLSDPIKLQPARLLESEQQFLAFHPAPSPFAATGWFAALSEPVRFLPTLPSAEQHFFEFEPTPIIQIGWYEPLSEPVRFLPALPTTEQHFFEFEPTPIISIGWYEPLSEPVRFLPALPAVEQHYFEFEPTPIISIGWYEPLSEPPVLAKSGLRSDEQQFFTTWFVPYTSTLTLQVTERPDTGPFQLQVFAGGLSRAIVSITEVGPTRASTVSEGNLIVRANVSIIEV